MSVTLCAFLTQIKCTEEVLFSEKDRRPLADNAGDDTLPLSEQLRFDEDIGQRIVHIYEVLSRPCDNKHNSIAGQQQGRVADRWCLRRHLLAVVDGGAQRQSPSVSDRRAASGDYMRGQSCVSLQRQVHYRTGGAR